MNQHFSIKLILGFFIIAGFVYFVSFASVNELITPLRVDSLYVKLQEEDFRRQQGPEDNKLMPRFYYSPKDFDLAYTNLTVTTMDCHDLKGWFVPSKNTDNNITILIIHDLNESRITSLATVKQFHDRGYNVCLFDMRAHGDSEGEFATYGHMEKYDLRSIADTLSKKFKTENIAVLGIGAGAAIALQAANMDLRIKVVIAQSPFNNLYNFVQTYADEKWGVLNPVLFPLVKKHLEDNLKFELNSVDIVQIAKKLTIPCLFIVGTADKIVKTKDTRAVFDACISMKKQYWPVRNATHYTIEESAGTAYYDRISIFLVTNSPKKIKKTRYKKFV